MRQRPHPMVIFRGEEYTHRDVARAEMYQQLGRGLSAGLVLGFALAHLAIYMGLPWWAAMFIAMAPILYYGRFRVERHTPGRG